MKIKLQVLILGLISLCCISFSTSAALLGISGQLDYPQVFFLQNGAVAYNATTDIYTVQMTPVLLQTTSNPASLIPFSPAPAPTLAVSFSVDQNGAVVIANATNTDLVMTGTAGAFSGTLLTARVLDFGFSNVTTTDFFDMRFKVTGGSMAALFGDAVGMDVISENSTFTGVFTSNFAGDAKGTLGKVPNPSIKVEKLTNGFDADMADESATSTGVPTVPSIMPGALVTWTYQVMNTGNTALNPVKLIDDAGTPGNPADDFCTPNAGACAIVINCPLTALNPGQSMNCTATQPAHDLTVFFPVVPGTSNGVACNLYENGVVVTGKPPVGPNVTDDDPSHYCNPPAPAIKLEKLTNGFDADMADESSTSMGAPTVPSINAGAPVTWNYLVTNTGNTVLNPVKVTDDAGTPLNLADDFCTPNAGPCAVVISCPKTILVPAETMNCTAVQTAHDLTVFSPVVQGQCGGVPRDLYENGAVTTGTPPVGPDVMDDDPSHYCNPPAPAIKLEKFTNGFDADTADESSTSSGAPTVPSINPGMTVTWTYIVTNTGNTVLDPVTVSDNAGTPGNLADDFCTPNAGACAIVINCPLTALNSGQMMNCSAQQPAHNLTVFSPVVPGQCGGVPKNLYENGAVTTGTPPTGPNVTDDDPSHYCNPGECNLEVNKTCLVIPPPQPNVGSGSCQKPIDVLKLEYAGGTAITSVTWYSGEVSPGNLIRSTTATEVTTLNNGGVVEFNGFEVNDSPNDVQMVTSFVSGPSITSEFHLSCSDPEMKGPEHCGTVIGDGKDNNLPASSNIWVFAGTARLPADGGDGISCPLPPAPPGFPTATACEFSPPQSAASCDDIKDITALTMIWQGANGVNILTENGESINGINNGDVVTFSTVNGSNDFELTLSGATNGTSIFHLSCSDDDMDGPDDCGMPQGNAKDNDDLSLINQWALEGMTGENGVIDCAVVQGRSGADVLYGIEVKNLNNVPVNVTITDSLLGVNQVENIAANTTFQLEVGPTLIVPDSSDTFINIVNVTGQTATGDACSDSASAMLTRKPPPPPPISCKDIEDITALSMIWDGANGVNVAAPGGEQFLNVQKGDQINFTTVSGNDQVLNLSGAVSGISTFHVSCSDQEMNGSEDCGTNQGNGKDNSSGFNDWLLNGMTGEQGSFDCGLYVAASDTDGDGVDDLTDNCTNVANPLQQDADGDGHGNMCDADFNNTCGPVDFTDLASIKAAFFTVSPPHDLDSSGTVDFTDLALFKGMFNAMPGPSAAGICP